MSLGDSNVNLPIHRSSVESVITLFPHMPLFPRQRVTNKTTFSKLPAAGLTQLKVLSFFSFCRNLMEIIEVLHALWYVSTTRFLKK